MKRNVRRNLFVLAVVLVISTIIFIFLKSNASEKSIFSFNRNGQSQNDTGILEIAPGQSYVLEDNESTIRFNSGGSATAVPDIIFGANYTLNDIHAINHLPIRKEITFYNKGYLFTLKNLGCESEERFTDVRETWVTQCDIAVKAESATVPSKKIVNASKEITANQPYKGALISDENAVIVYAKVPNLSLQIWEVDSLRNKVGLEKDKMTSASTTTPYDITFITGLGIETIRFTADELWNKATKSVKVGSLEISATVKDYSCKIIYIDDEGKQTQRCDNVIFELSVVGNDTYKHPVNIINYSE